MAADLATIQRVKRTGMGVLLPRDGMATLSSILMATQQMHDFDAKWSAVPIEWSTLLQKACNSPFLYIKNMFYLACREILCGILVECRHQYS